MFYKKFSPSPSLESFIHSYYIWENLSNSDFLTIESPPSAFGGIVFNLGDSYKVGVYDKELIPVSNNYFAGQATKSYTLELRGVISMVGIVLKATSLFHFFGLNQGPYVNAREDLCKILGAEVVELNRNLKKSQSAESKIELIENYLISLLTIKNLVRDRFDESVDYIDNANGNISLHVVLKLFGYKPRYYQKMFQKRVGVSPKTYIRMRRMSYICYLLSSSKEINWLDIVHEGGYFDQSHFIKDFLDFIGRNPSAYFKNNKELARLLN